jgi:hypothetical protein
MSESNFFPVIKPYFSISAYPSYKSLLFRVKKISVNHYLFWKCKHAYIIFVVVEVNACFATHSSINGGE